MFCLRLDASTYVRPLESRDAQPLFEAIRENVEHLRPWMPWAETTRSADDTLAYIKTTLEQIGKENGFIAIIIHDGKPAGGCGLHRIDRANRFTTLGYWIAKKIEGRGYVTRTTAAMVDWAIFDQDLHRVELRAAVENRRSRAVAERLGFQQEGVARDAERIGERYHSLVVYSMLGPDWRRLRGERRSVYDAT